MENNKGSFWARIIESIDSPLGFFVLALLIVEVCITIILTSSQMPKGEIFNGLLVGSGLFCLVIIAVFILVFFKPENLTFDKASHLKRHETEYGYGKERSKTISASKKASTPVKPMEES